MSQASVKPPIIFVAYYYPPDVESGAARPHRLAKYLARLGHQVEVISAASIMEPAIEGNVHRLRGGGIRHPNQDFPAQIERILRHAMFPHDSGVVWAWRVAEYAGRWMRQEPKPIVFSTAPPATTHVAAYLMKRRYGVRWIADFRDPMIGNPYRSGKTAEFVDARLEPLFFRHADMLIANTDTVLAGWKKAYPQWQQKMHVLWNGFDPEEELQALPTPPRDYRVLAYVGAIYNGRDPYPVLRSVRRLIENGHLHPGRFRVQFTGIRLGEFTDSPLVDFLISQGCLQLQDPVPRHEAQRLMATSDYLLLLDVLSDKAGLQVPAKLFEYVRIGRPVVATTTEGSPVDRILRQSSLRYTGLYKGASDEEIDRRLLEFVQAPSDPRLPSKWFRENFDARNQAEFLSGLGLLLCQ